MRDGFVLTRRSRRYQRYWELVGGTTQRTTRGRIFARSSADHSPVIRQPWASRSPVGYTHSTTTSPHNHMNHSFSQKSLNVVELCYGYARRRHQLRLGIITTRKICNPVALYGHGTFAIGRYCRNARFRPEQALSLLMKESGNARRAHQLGSNPHQRSVSNQAREGTARFSQSLTPKIASLLLCSHRRERDAQIR